MKKIMFAGLKKEMKKIMFAGLNKMKKWCLQDWQIPDPNVSTSKICTTAWKPRKKNAQRFCSDNWVTMKMRQSSYNENEIIEL